MRRNIRINPLFFGVLLIVFFLGFLREYILMFLILFLHEAGHLIVLCGEKTEISYIKIEPFGITIRFRDRLTKNPGKEIISAFAGPLTNFILALLALIIAKERLKFFILANLSMGIFNLLPIYPLDGGRILKAFFSMRYGYIKSFRFVFLLSAFISALTIFFGIYMIIRGNFNFSLCLTGCFLFFNLLTEKNQHFFYLAGELNEYKKKNSSIEKMPVVHIAVNKNFPVRKIIKELSLTRYMIFSVIDNGKCISQLTEGELIEGLINKKAGIRIKDII